VIHAFWVATEFRLKQGRESPGSQPCWTFTPPCRGPVSDHLAGRTLRARTTAGCVSTVVVHERRPSIVGWIPTIPATVCLGSGAPTGLEVGSKSVF